MMEAVMLFLLVVLPLSLGAPASYPGCIDMKGIAVKEGQFYSPSGHTPCKQCLCKAGGYEPESCLEHLCKKPTCPGKPIKGECCGWKCYKGCQDINGTEVIHGEKFKSENHDVCMTCTCVDGQSGHCMKVKCDIPEPTNDCLEWGKVKGQCCKFECLTRKSQRKSQILRVKRKSHGIWWGDRPRRFLHK